MNEWMNETNFRINQTSFGGDPLLIFDLNFESSYHWSVKYSITPINLLEPHLGHLKNPSFALPLLSCLNLLLVIDTHTTVLSTDMSPNCLACLKHFSTILTCMLLISNNNSLLVVLHLTASGCLRNHFHLFRILLPFPVQFKFRVLLGFVSGIPLAFFGFLVLPII